MTPIRSFLAHAMLLAGIGLMTGTASRAAPTVTFINRTTDNATVQLIGPSDRNVSVPRGQQRTVPAAPGRYHIKVAYGEDNYAEGNTFDVKPTSRIRITLHRVVCGNYPSRRISKAEFQRRSRARAGHPHGTRETCGPGARRHGTAAMPTGRAKRHVRRR